VREAVNSLVYHGLWDLDVGTCKIKIQMFLSAAAGVQLIKNMNFKILWCLTNYDPYD